MKSRLEILAEVLKPEEKELSILKRYFTSDCVSPKNCIEAMKIAMWESWWAKAIQSLDYTDADYKIQRQMFERWFNKLEGGKDDTDNTDNH